MDRDKQIELMSSAQQRVDSVASNWMSDPRVIDAVLINHEKTRERKGMTPHLPRRKCA